jgi:UDP-N-acetylmuramyl pentapeptide phosphotransferase/UDP-N-acetylglucosamine-1-phosphate transferase
MDYRIIAAFFVSLPVSVILYKIFIPVLRKVKLGQKILEIGPAWHKCKEGTPVLGGLFFSVAMLVSLIIFLLPKAIEKGEYGLLAVAGLALANGMIGFIDDYVKLFKKRNKGLTVTQKLILQFLVAAVYLWVEAGTAAEAAGFAPGRKHGRTGDTVLLYRNRRHCIYHKLFPTSRTELTDCSAAFRL